MMDADSEEYASKWLNHKLPPAVLRPPVQKQVRRPDIGIAKLISEGQQLTQVIFARYDL
jgi:hypothetical protein